MPIKSIDEIKNNTIPKQEPIKEKMNITIPNIKVMNIPNRNGFIYILSGSGGSGKTNLLLNFFKNKKMYRNIFDNIYYFCPIASYASISDHPFKNHDKIYHELSVGELESIYQELVEIKKTSKITEYSCIIIDDFADALKDKSIIDQLNKMIIKARHIGCAFIFTLQSYYYFPKQLRKQITNITIFKTKNIEEWNTLAQELMNLNKDDALKLFNYAFNEPYNHLDINTVDNTYYKNWNELKFLE
jgi:hypothetical protein